MGVVLTRAMRSSAGRRGHTRSPPGPWALRWSLSLNANQSLREFDSFGDESEASSPTRKRQPERTLDRMPAVPSDDQSYGW